MLRTVLPEAAQVLLTQSRNCAWFKACFSVLPRPDKVLTGTKVVCERDDGSPPSAASAPKRLILTALSDPIMGRPCADDDRPRSH